MKSFNSYNIAFLFLTIAFLSGCGISAIDEQPISKPIELVNTQPVCLTATGIVAKCKNKSEFTVTEKGNSTDFKIAKVKTNKHIRPYLHSLENARSSVMLGEYIEQLSMDLISNLKSSSGVPLVGVTSIVEVSSNLSTITPLSNVITEEFITELQHKNIYVVDYKITNSITVSPYGEFVFYRNSVEELSEDKINHVLAGTLTYTKQGIIVNARVVEFESKKVISSAKKLIPYFVFDSVITG